MSELDVVDARIGDQDLTHLEVSRLLGHLVDAVEERLRVDTASVLVLDRAGTHLVARVGRGLERTVEPGVRIPVWRGFAGRIAATRAPVHLTDIGPDTVTSPVLWEQHIRSMLGVPLLAEGRLLGVMHVGTFAERVFDEADVHELQLLAGRAASALLWQRNLIEASAARTLQESLLPTGLPDVPGLEFASRFVAAEDFGVGGDWFDSFSLPSGEVGVVIGDVAGSGLRAAIVMNRLRSALRAYAIESETPSEALARLARKFAHFEPGEMATILYLTVAADRSRISVASLGHLPPVLAVPGAEPELLDCRPRPPIGARVDAERVDVVRDLAPGTTIACYTDGLVERRRESLAEGLERLRQARTAGEPDDVCRRIMTRLVGAAPVHDDTALLVFRRTA